MPGNAGHHHGPRGRNPSGFVAAGLILTGPPGEGRAWAGGEHVPLFRFWVLHPPANQQLWALWEMASGHAVPSCHPLLTSHPEEGGWQKMLWRGRRDGWVEVVAHKSGLFCTLLLALAGKTINLFSIE